jgi:hypothetical protein
MENKTKMTDYEIIKEARKRGLLNGPTLTEKGRNVAVEVERNESEVKPNPFGVSPDDSREFVDMDMSIRLMQLLKLNKIRVVADLYGKKKEDLLGPVCRRSIKELEEVLK